MADEPHPERRREAFFGRLKGPRLRPGQLALLRETLPPLRLDLDVPAPDDLAALFSAPVSSVRLEIGFGGGEHLLHEAQRQPETGFIGVEPFVNGMVKLLAGLVEAPRGAAPRGNVRLYDDDAVGLLDWLPPASLAGVDLLYPDPWPKKRHFKRRFVNARNLDRLARVMKPGALFSFASDIDTYVDWTLVHCRDHPAFEWTARSAADWREPFEGWPGTRYEAKAIREGRAPAYLSFRRRSEV